VHPSRRGAKGDHRRPQIRRAVGAFPELAVDQASNGVILGLKPGQFASLAKKQWGGASLRRPLKFAGLTVCICLGSGGFATGQGAIDINPALPSDIAGGATKATLQQAAAFAWQEFIALNWPAMAGQRDVADTSQKFGANAGGVSGALVWQTFRGKVEIFNTVVDHPGSYVPPGYDGKLQDLGYNTPPAYFYGGLVGRPVQACPGQAAPASPAWINADETTEIGLAQMFAGGPAIQDSANSSPQLIRYAVKANHVEYDYIAKNQYYLPTNVSGPNGNDGPAGNNKEAYNKSPPVAPTPPFISFPTGTIEIKSAWRPLNNYDQPTRFHVQTLRFYEKKGGPNHNLPCYFEQQWGLIALHIIQKTPTAPAFIYATFEQADNLRQPDATPVEDPDGNVTQPIPGAAPTTPALAYQDSSTAPKVTTIGASKSCTPQNNLYFKDNLMDPGLTGGGAICVNQRYEPIPPDVIAVNNEAHQAITAYNTANGVVNSPWLFYKLVSVQASPFDVSAKSPTDPVHSPAVFYQANIVVETNYTLQQFLGRISNSMDGAGAPTSLGGPPPPNVVTSAPTPPNLVGVNMGGCMGCHGNAQVTAGTDFSFILAGGPTYGPDTPSAIGDAQLRAKYLDLFQH
jgi:hypothetical protein